MQVSEFDFDLPSESIAQKPLSDRAASRLLRLERVSGSICDTSFRELPEMLRPDDLLVLNDTRVFSARLYGRRGGQCAEGVRSGSRNLLQGKVEVLLTQQMREDPNEWQCLVKPGRKIGVGEKLHFDGPDSDIAASLEAEVLERRDFGERLIRFATAPDFFSRLEKIGHTPLPPYIRREDAEGKNDSGIDKGRYQTVYARSRGSVAAPTAGLHFTDEILKRIRERGIEIVSVTLHVGLGTFQPVRVERVEEHKLHRERYEISTETAAAVNRAKAAGRRIVAVGTTTVRTLEYATDENENRSDVRVRAGSGDADIFIYPGYRFRVVDAILTNFHLPQSTLLMLVCAFGGKTHVINAYHHAVSTGYRFYSYGDCMFVE